MAAELKILGAAQTVTGSKYLLSFNDFNILVDCGLYQGSESKDLKDEVDFPASKIDALILTHAHLDHCGFIPRLVRDGFKGPIFSTEATRDLSRIILMDSAKIQLSDIKQAKKKNLSKHQQGEPLYYDHEVKFAMSLFRPLEYFDNLKLGPFEIIMHQAGHVPGAASVGISWDGGSLLFSGDLGRFNDLMTFDPKVVGEYEKVVMESTYGGNCHSMNSQFEELKSVLEKTKKKKGTLLVPAFSFSRIQLLLLQMKEVFNTYPQLKLPLYINSPMANEVTEVMILHNQFIKQSLEEMNDAFKEFHFVHEPWEVKSLYQSNTPKIILTASGMLTGGRVLTHLEGLGENPNNIVFIPGFQAPGTTGADLIEGNRELEINDKILTIKAEVIHSDSFSAHADSEELIKWIGALRKFPSEIFLVHGEPGSMAELKEKIQHQWESARVVIPNLNEVFPV